MGNLLLYPQGFLFNKSKEENIKVLEDFLSGANHARRNGDNTYFNSQLANFAYAWGNFFVDFAYSNWANIQANPLLSWIPQVLHQILQSFFQQNPSGLGGFANYNELEMMFAGQLNGEIGCLCENKPELYVSCTPTWYQWRINYFQANPEKYNWRKEDDPFLPNKAYTDQILYREIERHGKLKSLIKYDNRIGVTFHEEVMRHKGAEERVAYAIEIGGQIAELNYYKYDGDLTHAEEEVSHSRRRIYSFTSRDGGKQYISLDLAHGMFEYHDSHGNHLGENKYDGSYTSPSDPTHNLHTL